MSYLNLVEMNFYKKFRKLIRNLLTRSSEIKFRKRNIPPNKQVKKILIISLYFRGDFLFHTSLLRYLKSYFSNPELDVWVKSINADIASNNDLINDVLVFDDVKISSYNEKANLNFKGKFNHLKKIRANDYDIIIDLTGKYSTAIYTLFSKARYSIGLNYQGFGFCYDSFINTLTYNEPGHLIEKYLNVIKIGFNIDEKNWQELVKVHGLKPYISIPEPVKNSVIEKLNNLNYDKDRKLIIIHTTAGWKEKEWDESLFAKLFLKLIENCNIIFIGSSDDEKKLIRIFNRMSTNYDFTKYFFKGSFLESCELIRISDLIIGSDSAPLHVSGAFNTPSIGLFGPTNPNFSNPIGNMHKVVYHELFCSSSESTQYCTRNAGRTCLTIDCMKMIELNQVLKEVDLILENGKSDKQ